MYDFRDPGYTGNSERQCPCGKHRRCNIRGGGSDYFVFVLCEGGIKQMNFYRSHVTYFCTSQGIQQSHLGFIISRIRIVIRLRRVISSAHKWNNGIRGTICCPISLSLTFINWRRLTWGHMMWPQLQFIRAIDKNWILIRSINHLSDDGQSVQSLFYSISNIQ